MPTSSLRPAMLGSPMGLSFPASYRPDLPLVGLLSPCALGDDLAGMGVGSTASTTYPAANRAIAFMFVVADHFLVRKVWWVNGTTATTDSADVGVYTEAGDLLVSGGGTAIATANVVQEVDVTDTLLQPGRYWCAYAQSGTTATPMASPATIALVRAMGVAQMASAYVLPATFVPAAAASAVIPFCGISSRTQVA